MKIETLKRGYAKVIVGAGVDVKKDQLVHITCPVQLADFATLVAEEAFLCGAKDVDIEYTDTNFAKVRLLNASDEALQNPPKYKLDQRLYYTEKGSALITLALVDPNSMTGVDVKKTMLSSTALRALLEGANRFMFSNQCTFTLCCVPEQTWADIVFPNEKNSLEKLWDIVCTACRVKEEAPIESWKNFNSQIKQRGNMLSELKIRELNFKNSLGTDLSMKLVDNHLWSGGGISWGDKTFFPNIPTEEIFTSPHRMHVDGIAIASMPLVYNGNLIKDFWIKFKDGKVSEFDAKQGKELLQSIINTDDGSARLGEVALVQHNSPISKLNTLFYSTLFDENAACHIALGNAYTNTLKNSRGMTKEQLEENGLNVSKVHVDFMIGTYDMEIIAINDKSEKIKIFTNGNWAI